MSQQNPHDPFTLPNNSAISRYRRVVLTAGFIALAAGNQRGIGVLQTQTQSTDAYGQLRTLNGPGTRILVASGAITQYADIYAADNGKIAATGVKKLGYAMEAASADGDEIECQLSEPARLEPLYTSTADSTAVTATTTETLFDTNYAIPANTLKKGDRLRIRYRVVHTATNSTDTSAIKLYIGGLTGTLLISHAATDVANGDTVQGEIEIIVRDIGATGHIVATGTYKSVPAAAGTATYKDAVLDSTVIDTTVAQTVGISETWSTSNAGNSSVCRYLSIDRIAA